MIQPISYSNVNFRGDVKVSIKNAPNKGIDEIISKIPGETEKEAFRATFDTFTREIADATPDDASFLLEVDHDDWFVGDILKSGKSVNFEMKDLKDSERTLYKGQLPIVKKDGTLWKKDESEKKKEFTKDIEKFFNRAKRTILDNFNFNEAIKRARAPKERPNFLSKLSEKS